MTHPLYAPIAVAGMSHHNTRIDDLEQFRFPDEKAFLRKARERFRGVVLLQTCNRVEVLVHGSSEELTDFLATIGRKDFFIHSGTGALRHLLKVAAGIDSMIVGEDQILGQLRQALITSQEEGTGDSVVELCLNKAIHVGVEARRRTEINRGAVSIGSAAVQLAEQEIGSLEGRHILVIGSGEMGRLVAQALSVRHLSAIYVANRTYARAEEIAKKIGGRAVRMGDLTRYLALSDVVISCTAAPHPVIRCDELAAVMKSRCWPLDGHPRPLLLIDIAQPRDVEEGAEKIDGVRLFSIDNLRSINEQNMQTRREEADKAGAYVEEELDQFIRLLNSRAADDTLAALHTWAEAIRTRERDRAIGRLPKTDEKTGIVLDDLTRVLVKKILTDATFAIRSCAERGELETADAIVAAITRGEVPCSRTRE